MTMTKSQAKLVLREYQRRQQKNQRKGKARNSLLDFIVYMNPAYIVNWHHEAICNRLSKLRHEEGKKIMIFVGPQRGKSEIVSRNFPAWWLGHFPGSKNILASYSADLANGFNRDAQNIIAELEYSGLFPDTITAHVDGYGHLKKTQNEFHTSEKGYFYSVGVGGTTTGKSAGSMGSNDEDVQKGVFICDDPIKDLQDAFSATQKKRKMDWWRAVVNTRIHKTSHQVLMHTRWATDDIAGTLLAEGAIDKGWEVLSFPELGPDPDYPNEYDPRTNPDDPLWPEEKGAYDELMELKEDVGIYVWSSLFQQKPTVQGGNIIKEEWINQYTQLPFDPRLLRSNDIVQSWDLSFKKTQTGSYVVGVTIVRYQANFYLVDIFRERADIIKSKKAIREMSDSWPNCNTVLIEEKANGSAILTLLKKEVSGMISVLPDGTKDERLVAVSPTFEAGNFYVNANNVHTKDVISELTTFPSSAHDDIVDAISQGLSKFGTLTGLALLRAALK